MTRTCDHKRNEPFSLKFLSLNHLLDAFKGLFLTTHEIEVHRIKEKSNLKEPKLNISFLLGTFLYSDFQETNLKETQKNLSPTLSLIKRKLFPF